MRTNSFNSSEIGQRLKSLRQLNGLTQKEVASEFGTSQQVIQRFEKGKARPTAEFIFWASGYYGVSSDFVISGQKSIDQNPEVTETSKVYGIGRLSKDEIELIHLYRDADITGKAAAKSVLNVYQPKTVTPKKSG